MRATEACAVASKSLGECMASGAAGGRKGARGSVSRISLNLGIYKNGTVCHGDSTGKAHGSVHALMDVRRAGSFHQSMEG
jgi:hypothetical protein